MEVFHPGPGTAYSFSQPGKHHEEAKILAAKKAIERRFVPVLEEKFVPYEIHLFAENHDAKAEKIGQTILKCADTIQTELVVIARHNKDSQEKDRFVGNVGSVAAYVSKNCRHPVAIVDPEKWGL
jgi:nucleotide-binding universal stress UspA family protein